MEDGLFQTLHLPPPPSLSKLVFPQVESLSQLEQRAEKKTHFLCEFADQLVFLGTWAFLSLQMKHQDDQQT